MDWFCKQGNVRNLYFPHLLGKKFIPYGPRNPVNGMLDQLMVRVSLVLLKMGRHDRWDRDMMSTMAELPQVGLHLGKNCPKECWGPGVE
jgi:hypothetical protein